MTAPASIRLLASALTLTLPAALGAQSSGETPFQRGQWAIELSGTDGSGNLGFLRFTSPRSAWIIAPGLSVSRGTGTLELADDFSGPLGGDADIDFFGIDLRVGRRRYQPLGGAAVSFLGMGVRGFSEMLNATSTVSDGVQSATQDEDDEALGGGLYGELGGSYHFTPRFAVGASATADLSYAKVRNTTEIRDDGGASSFQSVESRDWSLDMAQTRVFVTIVF